MPAGIDAAVVNYNAGGHLLACVRSLRADGRIGRIVVADNASSDGSVDALVAAEPTVEVVRLARNLGFGTAANRAVAATTSPYVMVLNPDTVVSGNAATTLARLLDHDPGVAVVGPRIEDPDGNLYPSARSFPSLVDSIGHGFLGLIHPDNRFTRRYRPTDTGVVVAGKVDWVSGACFLVRRSAFDAVGGFDESFFMYVEDVDLCWRLGRAGWTVAYEPDTTIVHVLGVSSSQAPYRMIAEHHRSLMRFALRTTTGSGRALLPVVGAGLVLRTALAWARHAIIARTDRRSR